MYCQIPSPWESLPRRVACARLGVVEGRGDRLTWFIITLGAPLWFWYKGIEAVQCLASEVNASIRASLRASLKRVLSLGSSYCLGAQSYPTLCNPMNAPGSSVYGILQEYWSRLPFPSPGDLPHPGIEPNSPASPALTGRTFTTEPPGKPTLEAVVAAYWEMDDSFDLVSR